MSNPADVQDRAERAVAGMMARDAFSRWLGMEILETAPHRSRCRMTVRDEMVNGFGVAHGGIVFSFADSAFAFACNTHGLVTVAIENAITYPEAIHRGDILEVVAELEAESNRLSYYRADVTNQHGQLVALFRGTAYKTRKPHPGLDPA